MRSCARLVLLIAAACLLVAAARAQPTAPQRQPPHEDPGMESTTGTSGGSDSGGGVVEGTVDDPAEEPYPDDSYGGTSWTDTTQAETGDISETGDESIGNDGGDASDGDDEVYQASTGPDDGTADSIVDAQSGGTESEEGGAGGSGTTDPNDAGQEGEGSEGQGNACECTDEDAPVCTVTGRVYTNKCYAECADLEVRRACVSDVMICSLECRGEAGREGGGGGGTGGILPPRRDGPPGPMILPGYQFRNRTVFDRDSNSDGAAAPNCTCASQPAAPVCGDSSKVYKHACAAKCAKDAVRYPCGNRKDCKVACKAAARASSNCNCITQYAPVCAANGKIYSNACQAECAKKQVVFPCGLKKVCAKACKDAVAPKPRPQTSTPPSAGCVCPFIHAPVCGKDGKVHSNACMAKCNKTAVRFACKGSRKACKKDCVAAAIKPKPSPKPSPAPRPAVVVPSGCKQCNSAYKPVCSKNGMVYPNPCLAQCDNAPPVRFWCGARKDCATVCTAAADAPAGVCKCPARQQEVCSTSGKLYYNGCMAKCHKAPLRWECGKRKNCAKACQALAALEKASKGRRMV